MYWLTTKIEEITSNINLKDIAFLLASTLEINKVKDSREKLKIALDFLSSHKSFKDYIFEFYLKENNKLRCVAISPIVESLKNDYLGKSISNNDNIYVACNLGKVLFFDKIEENKRSPFLDFFKINSYLVLPCKDFGALVVNRNDSSIFSDYEVGFLNNFVANVVSPSLDLALDNEKNMELAIRDSLTGLYNHGYFKFRLEREVENAKRSSLPLSLIMIDVDYFKHYNDTHGHIKGDLILADLAKIFRANTRVGDLVTRYGGEEFAILLFNINLDDALKKAEEIRLAVENHKFDMEDKQPNGDLTISLGVASLPTNASDAISLLENSDKALYKAKNSGKNKVIIYEEKI